MDQSRRMFCPDNNFDSMCTYAAGPITATSHYGSTVISRRSTGVLAQPPRFSNCSATTRALLQSLVEYYRPEAERLYRKDRVKCNASSVAVARPLPRRMVEGISGSL